MALTEREKRNLKEKYKEWRRESWGLRQRKRRGLTDRNSSSEAERVKDSYVDVSVLRRAEEPVVSTPSQESVVTGSIPDSEDSDEKPIITLEPVGEPEAVGLSEEAVSSPVGASAIRSDRVEREDTRRQLREKIKEQRRATWADERSTPRLTTPPKRKSEKAEREFWDDPPPREAGISLGVALLIVLGCVGVVAIGVLLGYLLTAF